MWTHSFWGGFFVKATRSHEPERSFTSTSCGSTGIGNQRGSRVSFAIQQASVLNQRGASIQPHKQENKVADKVFEARLASRARKRTVLWRTATHGTK